MFPAKVDMDHLSNQFKYLSNSFLRTFHPKAYCCMSILFQPQKKKFSLQTQPKQTSFEIRNFSLEHLMLRFEVARVPVKSDTILSPPKKMATSTLPGDFGGVTTFHKVTSVINYQKYLTLSRQTKGHDSIKHVLALGHPNLR